MSAPPSTLDAHSLSEMVRSWVHFDNLAATFSRQAQQARTARARWEAQVIDHLRASRMTNAILQIAGGRLTVHEEKHAQPLTLQRLESLLHEFYAQRPAGSDDETVAILAFIKSHRSHTLETRLKKS
jgi:hypothetical protein